MRASHGASRDVAVRGDARAVREHVGASILINLSIIVVVVYQQVNEYTNSSLTVINLTIVVQYDAQCVYHLISFS